MKKIKLTERQVIMLRDMELNETNINSPSYKLKKTMRKGLKGMKDKIKIENDVFIGHPVGGDGGDEYNPQDIAQNKKTYKSFNENFGGINKKDLAQMIKDVVKSIMLKQRFSNSPIFKHIKLKPGQLLKFLNDNLLINNEDGIKVSKVRFKPTVDDLYDRFMLKSIQTEQGGYPAGAEFDSNAPWNQPDAEDEPEQEFIKADSYPLQLVHYNLDEDGVAIFKKDGKLLIHIGGYHDGEMMNDYCYDPSGADSDCVNNFINDLFNNGQIKVGTNPFKDLLAIVTPQNKQEILKYYGGDERLVKVLGGLGETTTAGASSGAFVTKLQMQENVKKITMFSDEAGIEAKTMESVIAMGDDIEIVDEEEENVDETTTTASVGGSYVTPKVWAKSKKDRRFKEPMYPGGKIVENNQTDTAYPGGAFVELDDCTKLNNNKKAQSGKCSQGAADGVVKQSKSKNSVVSKDALYYEVAKQTGRPISEVKEILKNL